MFGNIGWASSMVLLIAALVILGPERLPGAVSWVPNRSGRSRLRQRCQPTAQDQLGPEFDDLRKPPRRPPQELRGMTPRAVITKHLLDGDDSVLKEPSTASRSGTDRRPGSAAAAPESKPLAAGERPPVDPDAT
ncbi:Sec-independent protein translocase subunit TatB [Rhodococcus hoagii]|nr:Sec-independent protein translocase subunit TatB [Prescottella equi]